MLIHTKAVTDFDFSMLIHKKPITVVASISLFYHTQSHLPSLHFLCVFNAAQTPIMSSIFSLLLDTKLLAITSLHVLHTQSHSLSPHSMLFIHTKPLTITLLMFHTHKSTYYPLRSMFYTHKATSYHFIFSILFFFFFLYIESPNIFFCTYLHSHQTPFGIVRHGALCICGEFEWLNPKEKRSGSGRGGGNPSKQQCTGVP